MPPKGTGRPKNREVSSRTGRKQAGRGNEPGGEQKQSGASGVGKAGGASNSNALSCQPTAGRANGWKRAGGANRCGEQKQKLQGL